jgi:hypothetical protein
MGSHISLRRLPPQGLIIINNNNNHNDNHNNNQMGPQGSQGLIIINRAFAGQVNCCVLICALLFKSLLPYLSNYI